MNAKAIILASALAIIPVHVNPTVAQGIEQLLIEAVPIPTPRPDNFNTSSVQTAAIQQKPVSGASATKVTTIKGSVKNGLDAVSKKNMTRALGIRAGLTPGTLDRKILAWAIALSGNPGVTSGEISNIANDLADWPGQKAMRANAEKALASEGLSARQIVDVFGNQKPSSVEGALILSRAHLDLKNKKSANTAISPFWREEKLDKETETKVLSSVGAALSRDDHRHRMHSLLYNDRAKAGLRVANLAEQTSLAKARAAALRKSTNARKLIKAVAPSSKKDVGYLFAQIEHERRSGNYTAAAKLLLKAPRDQVKLVDPDEWWVERRIVSREMLEAGDAKLAYKIAAEHSAKSASSIAEAEFHAGWYALRFLKDKGKARKHFAKILQVSSRPISQARGHYWLGRSNSGQKATDHYRNAARHSGTYYGQLAASKLGIKKLTVTKPRPNTSDRTRFKNRELIKAIVRLEAIGYDWRADIIYRHLARKLTNAGELALLSARAEKRGKFSLALQIGKLAHARGYAVDTLAWPLGAIPTSAKIGNTGRALAYSIARQESAFNPAAVSPANARGLLQLLPGTAKGVARRKGLSYSYKRLTRDAGYNATLGAAYLSEQLDNFGNSYILTFAGYNAGPRRALEWIERFGDPRGKPLDQVIDWVERIPFTETRNYVQRVMENYQVYKSRIDGGKLTIEKDLASGRG